jgi:hypothetical protein
MHIYKKAISISLIFLLCYSGMRPTFPLFQYIINYDYIAEVLCINKEKKVLQCNGKCQLTKEILKNESDGTSEYPQLNFEKFPNLFLEKLAKFHFRHPFCLLRSICYGHLKRYRNNLQKPLLPPPQFVIKLQYHA